MKGFSLKSAKEGHPVETKNGQKVRILCFDAKNNDYPIVALIENRYGDEHISSFTEYGEEVKDEESPTDLVMVEEPQPQPQSNKVFIEQILIEDGESNVITKVFSSRELARVQSDLDIDEFGMMYDGDVIERSPDKYIMESDDMKVTITIIERETIDEIKILDDAEKFAKSFTDRMSSDSITINKKQFSAFLKKTYIEITSLARMK